MADTDLAVQRLAELKALGVQARARRLRHRLLVAELPRRFPVDVLKMDRSFLQRRRLAARPRTSPTRSSRSGATLSLEVVAEGIELPEQWETLRELGCELGQGFYFARPMNADATRRSCAEGGPRRHAGARAPMHHSHEALDRAGGARPGRSARAAARPRLPAAVERACVSLLGDGAFLVASRGRCTRCRARPTAMSLVGIAMTVPTIVFLLVGGVASDRLERRWMMVAPTWCARWRSRSLAGADARRAARAVARGRAVGALRDRRRVLRAGLRRAGARRSSRRAPGAGQRAGPARAPAGAAAGRPGARRRARRRRRGRRGVRAGRRLVPVSAAALLDAPPARAAPARRRAGRWSPTCATGWRFVRGHAWLWATFASAAIAYLLLHGAGRGAAAVVVKEGLGGSAARPRPRLRRRRPRLDACAVALGRSACRAATSPSCTWPGRWRRWRSPATARRPRSGS